MEATTNCRNPRITQWEIRRTPSPATTSQSGASSALPSSPDRSNFSGSGQAVTKEEIAVQTGASSNPAFEAALNKLLQPYFTPNEISAIREKVQNKAKTSTSTGTDRGTAWRTAWTEVLGDTRNVPDTALSQLVKDISTAWQSTHQESQSPNLGWKIQR